MINWLKPTARNGIDWLEWRLVSSRSAFVKPHWILGGSCILVTSFSGFCFAHFCGPFHNFTTHFLFNGRSIRRSTSGTCSWRGENWTTASFNSFAILIISILCNRCIPFFLVFSILLILFTFVYLKNPTAQWIFILKRCKLSSFLPFFVHPRS